MTDYLTRLAQRAVTAAPAVRPRLPSAYEVDAGRHPSVARSDAPAPDLAAIQPPRSALRSDLDDQPAVPAVRALPLEAGGEPVERPRSSAPVASAPAGAGPTIPLTGSIRAYARSLAASGVRRSESVAAPASSTQAAAPGERAITPLGSSDGDQAPPIRAGFGNGERPELLSDAAAVTGNLDASERARHSNPNDPRLDPPAAGRAVGVTDLPRDAEDIVLPPNTPRPLTSDQPIHPTSVRRDLAQSGDRDRPSKSHRPDRRFVEPAEIRPRARSTSAVETGRLQADLSAVAGAASSGPDHAPAPEEPTVQRDVHVTIGRVEIRAKLAPTPRSGRPRAAAPGLSLESYLQPRDGVAR